MSANVSPFPIDAQTPRIVPSSFVEGAPPVGVRDLSYVISLDHFIDRALAPDQYADLIRQLAGAEPTMSTGRVLSRSGYHGHGRPRCRGGR